MLIPAMRSIVASALLLFSFNLHAIAPIYTLQGGLGGTDFDDDSDSYYYLTGSMLYSRALSNNSIVDLQAEISSYEYDDNENLSSEELFLQATYNYTPRAGYRVPTYSIGLRHLEEYLQRDSMDASTTTLILSMAYRVNDRSSLLGGIKAATRDSADDSDPTSYFINFDYRYTPEWLLYTTLGVGEGAFNTRSYCSGAYQSGQDYWNWNWNAWSDDCDNTFITLGASHAFNAFNSLDLSLGYYEYDTSSGDYTGNVYSVDFFHRF